MALYKKDGEIYNSEHGIEHDGLITYNATELEILNWGYERLEHEPRVISEVERITDLIDLLKQELLETDYIVLKAIEGYDCDNLYPGWKEHRTDLRTLINELESQLESSEEVEII